MPFGLSRAASNAQMAIDLILKPVIEKFVNVYMDDVIISSPSFTHHVEHLREVFRLLQEAGLSLNKENCKFGCDELKYLGLIISKERIKTDETKVRPIGEMKPPRNSKKEDFGKRKMPGKRARRHFSQLSEFERSLIIGMKTAGWSTHRVAGQVDRSECAVRNCWEQWTREGTHARKTGSGATKKTTRRENRRIVQQALVDPTVTRSTIRADEGVAIVSQTISRHLAEANPESKRPFRALPLTPEHRQLRLKWC
ncbi:transposable element Tc1 transposase [Trichonephila clavipes]|nr:transposable element Tc1 transposase [Trichonephila clavipes]